MAQNRIHHLLYADSNKPAGAVLKICRPRLAARRSLAHEARLYRNLARLADKYGPRIGTLFLQARAVLLHEDRSIVGLVIEKANGKTVDKRVSDPAFHDVRYVLALLSDVLAALDVAQRELGLVHYDLKLDNVLEHWGPDADAMTPETEDMQAALAAARDPRAGAAGAPAGPLARAHTSGQHESWESGLLPRFKIFDLGTSVVWPDPFSVAAMGIGAAAARPAHEAELPSAARAAAATVFGGVEPPVRPAAADQLEREAAGGGDYADHPEVVGRKEDWKGRHRFEFSKPFWVVRIYHMWWLRRGDAYRLLLSLSRNLDGRTWPVEDMEEVTLLLAFLEHATGTKRRLRAKFAPRSELEAGYHRRNSGDAKGRNPGGDGDVQGRPFEVPTPPAGAAAGAPARGPFAAPDVQKRDLHPVGTPQLPGQQMPSGAPDSHPAARPAAPPERQRVLGSRKPVRGAFAGQLLSEPLLQSLLTRLGPDERAPSVTDEAF